MFISKNTFKLLRFPFSFFLMPLFLLAMSQATVLSLYKTLSAFVIIHFFIYPASNGYNSFVDRDEGSIGGLERPPLPTRQLFYVTIFLDVAGLILAICLVNYLFALCLFIYICASRAYSAKQTRLKRYAVLGFLTVVFFQGAFTYFTSMTGIAEGQLQPVLSTFFILMACSLQIAGAYPLTQVYQHQQDLKDGVVTLSYRLGYNGTFLFTACMFLLCNVFYYLYFNASQRMLNFFVLQLFFLPVIVFFCWWFYHVFVNPAQANFKNTMRMNWVASTSMNLCFIVLYLINHY
ncbi:MAG: UbiA family prenyltransferase [Bacteroidota bacterium]